MAPTLRLAAAALLLTTAFTAQAQDGKGCVILLLHAPNASAAGLAPLAKKLPSACTTQTIAAGTPQDLARPIKQARLQGAKRVLLVGWGAAGNVAMAYAGSTSDVEGVAALAPEDKALPALAAGMPQHAPLLWVVGTGDALAAKGEAYLSKAPPHPATRLMAIKADAAALPEAAAKALGQWIKDAE